MYANVWGSFFSAPVNHKLQDSTVCLSCSTNFSQDTVETYGFVLFLNKYWNIICTEEQLYSRQRSEKKNLADECALSHIW